MTADCNKSFNENTMAPVIEHPANEDRTATCRPTRKKLFMPRYAYKRKLLSKSNLTATYGLWGFFCIVIIECKRF